MDINETIEKYLNEDKNSFDVGGLSFTAIRKQNARGQKYWQLKTRSGTILDQEYSTVNKMKDEVEYFWKRFGEKEFNRNFDI